MQRSKVVVSLDECRRRVANVHGAMLFETARPRQEGSSHSYFFEQPLQWIEIRTFEEIPHAFVVIEQALADGYWIAGYLSYECGYHWEPAAAPNFEVHDGLPLGAFGVYQASVTPLASIEAGQSCGLTDVKLSLSFDQFKHQFDQIQQKISAGDAYQVNLTCQVDSPYSQRADLLFAHMMQRQPVEFGAMLNIGGKVILSASPELFFERKGRDLRVRPMKGTSPRGHTADEDDRLAEALSHDIKNRAENVMIVDLLRSDVGRVAELGSVRVEDLFRVERHPSLLQMTSTIRASMSQNVSFYELFRATFPSGSIVGAPKVRAMQIIRALEKRDRGVYTGAIGYIAPTRDAVFSVAIRTAVLDSGHFTMGVGAGITADSVAESEFEECLLKGEFLRDRAFQLIESMRWEWGRCGLLELHLDRLERSARFFNFNVDRQAARQAITDYASRLVLTEAWKLRLTVDSAGIFSASASLLQRDTPAELCVQLWPDPIASSDPWLQHKTTRRALYDKAVQVAQENGCVDALFINQHAMVTEGAIHSVLVRHGDMWRTPPLSSGVLPGVYREHLLAMRPEILQQDVHVDELRTADQIFLMNAVRGLRQVQLQAAA